MPKVIFCNIPQWSRNPAPKPAEGDGLEGKLSFDRPEGQSDFEIRTLYSGLKASGLLIALYGAYEAARIMHGQGAAAQIYSWAAQNKIPILASIASAAAIAELCYGIMSSRNNTYHSTEKN